jgi:hypothetical protein
VPARIAPLTRLALSYQRNDQQHGSCCAYLGRFVLLPGAACGTEQQRQNRRNDAGCFRRGVALYRRQHRQRSVLYPSIADRHRSSGSNPVAARFSSVLIIRARSTLVATA